MELITKGKSYMTKQQEKEFEMLFTKKLKEQHFQGLKAVSYTHLDVYKRQTILGPKVYHLTQKN